MIRHLNITFHIICNTGVPLHSDEFMWGEKMVNEVARSDISYILSETSQIAYAKIKALILKIFSLLKRQENKKEDFKDEFEKFYLDFARKLKDDGHDDECYYYMSICEMYYNLMDRPEDLIANENFFMDFYNAFEGLLFTKIENPEGYELKSKEFLIYWGNMHDYYYNHVAIPSEFYDAEVLNEITNHLAGGFNE